jgi:hypothetical protein
LIIETRSDVACPRLMERERVRAILALGDEAPPLQRLALRRLAFETNATVDDAAAALYDAQVAGANVAIPAAAASTPEAAAERERIERILALDPSQLAPDAHRRSLVEHFAFSTDTPFAQARALMAPRAA